MSGKTKLNLTFKLNSMIYLRRQFIHCLACYLQKKKEMEYGFAIFHTKAWTSEAHGYSYFNTSKFQVEFSPNQGKMMQSTRGARKTKIKDAIEYGNCMFFSCKHTSDQLD